MTHRANIFCRLISILLVLYVGIVAGLSSGDRFILCFGADGHIDISFTDCSKCPPNVQKKTERLSNKNGHHGECLDIKLISCELGSERLALSEAGSHKFMLKKSDSSHISDLIFTSLLPSEHLLSNSLSYVVKRPFSASHFISLRTIILQI